MNQKSRKRYSPEFKAQAVELLSIGKPGPQVAEEFCISSNLLYRWKQDSQGAQVAQDHEPKARGPQRTTCAPCDAKTPSLKWRMTF